MFGFRRDAQGNASFGGVSLVDLHHAEGARMPAYVHDLGGTAQVASELVAGFGGRKSLVAYAVKANSAGSVLRRLRQAGTGADVVSGAELELAVASGISPQRIMMSGVAKANWEIDLALGMGIHALQLESVEEASRVATRARALGKVARVSIRVNPGVEADTHAHIATGHDEAKFGVARNDIASALAVVDASDGALSLVGFSGHVGSLLTETEPYVRSARVVAEVARARLAQGKRLEFVDFGGGFGIDYGDKPSVTPAAFARAAVALLDELGLGELELVVEPGRSLVGPYGVLVAGVIQSKVSGSRRWLMIEAGMNDLIRPFLYQARHRIEPLERPPGGSSWRVVGPVCESTDDFGDYALGAEPPLAVAIRDTGAYGYTMASEYNGRPLPTEIFVEDCKVVSISASPGRDAWIQRRLKS